MNILKIKDPQGNWVDIPALKGDKGDKGDPGISPTIDSTLSQANQAADAKAVGDKINEITLTIDGTLTQSGQVADAKVIGDALNTKANQNGYYENLNVGVADQLASKNYIEDNEAYTFRPTANGAKVGTREFDTIVGGSVVWNQLNEDNFTDASEWVTNSDAILSANNNILIITINNTPSSNTLARHKNDPKIQTGHKCLYSYELNPTKAVNSRFSYTPIADGTKQITCPADTWTKCTGLIISSDMARAVIYVNVSNSLSIGDTVSLKNFTFFDLTQMFGSEIADYIYNLEQTTPGAGVAWFRKYFPNDYYDYNPGELMHVTDLQSHDTVGFNLFDAETIMPNNGFIKKSDGAWYIASSATVSKKVAWENLSHYLGCVYLSYEYKFDVSDIRGAYFICNYTDGTNTYIYVEFNNTNYKKATFISNPNKVVKNIIFTYGGNISTWLKNICINLSRSGTRNGEYEPYTKHSYPLDSTLTLRGIPKLVDGKLSFDGDIYKPDGTIERRYGIVDLGTLSWTRDAVTDFYAFFSPSLGNNIKRGLSLLMCDNYVAWYGQRFNLYDKSIGKGNLTDSYTIYIRDDSYTDAISFKAAMSGVMLVYELPTPTIEEAEPYQSPQIIDPYGTEKYVTTSIVPVGHQTQYPEDLRAKIESLPWDFANLIAPVEATYKATQNYTAGSLFIVDNILYKTTANIANGGTITPNTNCTATTLAEIIAAL